MIRIPGFQLIIFQPKSELSLLAWTFLEASFWERRGLIERRVLEKGLPFVGSFPGSE